MCRQYSYFVHADDVRSFVSSMAVNVISCFEVKPRRRRPGEEGEIKDRKAFRLCIRADDRDLLLDASKWPNSIAVSEWFFSPPQVQNEKRRRLLGPGDSTSAVGNSTDGAAGAVAGCRRASESASEMEHEDNKDNDRTISLNTTAINACINDST